MKRLLFISVILFVLLSSSGIRIDSSPESPNLLLIWKSEIGNVTHRTVPAFKDGKIFIGSNGKYYRDFAIDPGNGVFVLSEKTGKIINQFGGETFGDMDVNGIVSINNTLIFGNDNDEVLCFDLEGKKKWRIPFSGDVEHSPSIVQIDGKTIPVFATETGEIRAIDPENGNTIWSFYDENFNGWKNGDNRFVFKVRMHFSEPQIFFDEPALADLNSDGTEDLIYNRQGNGLIAIDGKRGIKLWEYKPTSGGIAMRREKPLLLQSERKIAFFVYSDKSRSNSIQLINYNGHLVKDFETNISGYSLLSHVSNTLFTNSGITTIDKNQANTFSDSTLFMDDPRRKTKSARFYDGQVAKNTVRFAGEKSAIVLFQADRLHPNQAVLMIIGLKSGKVHLETTLPHRSEFTPIVRDVNKDGKLDVLVSCYDGFLYAYDLKIPNKNLIL
jgi:outer membrane protein assembly factor BamB